MPEIAKKSSFQWAIFEGLSKLKKVFSFKTIFSGYSPTKTVFSGYAPAKTVFSGYATY
jgi:hypothetical protein